MISYTLTPIQQIEDAVFRRAGVRVLIKREDRNHPYISGNKWWKLKYNLERALSEKHTTLLTFGGAYSNHLYAVAAAASELGMKSIGVVRGEETLPLNATLSFAKRMGMELHYVSRDRYRDKTTEHFKKELRGDFGRFYLIPEGGTNAEAVRGCVEFGQTLVKEAEFDVLCLPVATGGTMAGLVQVLMPRQRVIGFSVLRNGDFLEQEVRRWLPTPSAASWRIETRFDFGGFARATPELIHFIEAQRENNNLVLDPVYTSKTLMGIRSLVESGEFTASTTILMLHTGGLHGGVIQTNLKEPPTAC